MLVPGKKVNRCKVCERRAAERETPYCVSCVAGSCFLIKSEFSSCMFDVGWCRTDNDTIVFSIDVSPNGAIFRIALRDRIRPRRYLQLCKSIESRVETVECKVDEVVEEPDLVVQKIREKLGKYPIKLNGLLKRYWSFDLKEDRQGSKTKGLVGEKE